MNVLLLIFLVALSGQPETYASQFDTMTECEVARSALVVKMAEAPIAYLATACVVPVKVLGV